MGFLVFAAACGGGGGPDLSVPPLVPIVRSATPAALSLPRMASRSVLRRLAALVEGEAYAGDTPPDPATVAGAIQLVFKGDGVSTMGPTAGFIIGSISDVDHRKNEFDTIAHDSQTGCIDRTQGTLALSSLSGGGPPPVSSFTLANMRCRSHFMGDSAAGMVFGATIDENEVVKDYSIWTTPQNAGSADRFGYLVNVTDPEGSDPQVDFVYLENSTSFDPDRVMMFRLKARPSTLDPQKGIVVKSFQITMASSAGGVPSLQCGFRMISDGTLIWAEGRHGPSDDCSMATAFHKCFSASTMVETEHESDCDGMRTFDADMELVDGPSLASKGAAFSDLMDLSHATGSVDDF